MKEIIECDVCSNRCRLSGGQAGKCLARKCENGKIIPTSYGILSAIALDPIEKKPLYRFMPGRMILSVGGFGCNLKCPFCQNHEISQIKAENAENRVEFVGNNSTSHPYRSMNPEEITDLAIHLRDTNKNIGIAFTYNEPLVDYEYVRDTAKLCKKYDLKTVLVSNGNVSIRVLKEVEPYIDAMNIDLKGFTQESYEKLGGNLKMVMEFIEMAAKSTHIEITSLIVPGINDSLDDMEKEAKWISNIRKDIPLHITRFFPRYKMLNDDPTQINLMKEMKAVSEKYLEYVYLGNV
ncbi:MAG: AmmeMemoRadiSam system radical SAM enzyme [Butyrivibrio sp.]|nr:AmmeMemoRadiSam system radical SAM enzyme [Butyrivibrio sp.]